MMLGQNNGPAKSRPLFCFGLLLPHGFRTLRRVAGFVRAQAHTWSGRSTPRFTPTRVALTTRPTPSQPRKAAPPHPRALTAPPCVRPPSRPVHAHTCGDDIGATDHGFYLNGSPPHVWG